MRVSPKIFPAAGFLLVIGVSLILLIFPELIYRLLSWFIEAFQAGGLLILFVAMMVQALAIPIPSEFVLICGGAAFGLLPGWLVGTLGSVAAAFIGFSISRKGGRTVAIRFVGNKGIEFADNWFNRWGVWAVLLGRFAPFIPFDVISYSAGLTQMKLRSFMIPTGIGTLPRVLFYAFLGASFGGGLTKLKDYPDVPPELEGTIFMFNIVLLTIVIVMASILLAYWFVTRRYTAKQETKSI